MRLFSGILGAFIITAPFAFAQESFVASNNEITIYDSVCEKISANESKSSARVRATDKAVFNALQNLSLIQDYRDKTSIQDFNNKIYRLADNYLNSLNINTISQNDEELCIEISGFLPVKYIDEVFGGKPNTTINSEISDDNLTINLPPKPKITINSDIAYSEEKSDNIKEQPIVKQPTVNSSREIFVDRTEFFDGNSTNSFFEYIKSDLEQIGGMSIVNKMQEPDYILKTKVLKAKVDSLNSETNRLQVVVAVTLINTKTSENFTEHQNRFILFTTKENAQKTASALVRKLIAAAINKLSIYLEKDQIAETGNLIITPNK